MRHSIHSYFRGDISRVTLLTKLLPLSAGLLFGALIAGAVLFPGPYDWRERVVSHIISPNLNPDGYLVASMGVALSAALALPFAGYLEQRLHSVNPRAGRMAGLAFGVGFILLLSVAVPRTAQPSATARSVHEILARGSAIAITIGMICCCVCAAKDRLRVFGGQRSLRGTLALIWGGITLLLLTVGTVSGALKLGKHADRAWAEQVHEFFQASVFWQLAFWEWIGIVALFLFLFLSVLLLPEQIKLPQQMVPADFLNRSERR